MKLNILHKSKELILIDYNEAIEDDIPARFKTEIMKAESGSLHSCAIKEI